MTESEKLQYSINGDKQGYLVQSYNEKLSVKSNRGIMDITDEEFQAKLCELNSFKESLGGSDGSF